MQKAVLDMDTVTPMAARRVTVDFLCIDLEVCTRCLNTNANLEAALSRSRKYCQRRVLRFP